MTWRKPAAVSSALLAVLVIYNGFVSVPVALARKGEDGITMLAYRRWLIDPSTAVIDIWSIHGDKSMADVDRNLFKSAEALKDNSFKSVELAYHGRGRFMIDGDAFRQLGKEWHWQSVAHLMSVLPENARGMDGEPAFGTWTGGWLGVLSHQIEDHNDLHWKWYMASATGSDPESRMPDRSPTPNVDY